MTIGTYDLDRAFTNQARALDALDHTVSELRYNLDELSEDQDTLKRRVSMLETDGIEPMRSTITDLEEATEELQGAGADQDCRPSPGGTTHLGRTPRTDQRRSDARSDRRSQPRTARPGRQGRPSRHRTSWHPARPAAQPSAGTD
jgi:hypothetical protein